MRELNITRLPKKWLFSSKKVDRGYNCKELNNPLSISTKDVTINSNSIVKSHSLRAGIPSELAKRQADPLHIQCVSRQSSDQWGKILQTCKNLLIYDSKLNQTECEFLCAYDMQQELASSFCNDFLHKHMMALPQYRICAKYLMRQLEVISL